MSQLSDQAKQLKNEYMRNWRKNNPKIRKYQRDYWERQAGNKGE